MVDKTIKGLAYTLVIGALILAILLMAAMSVDILNMVIEAWTK